MITWRSSAVISIIVEGVLYGFSVFMFGLTIWALVYKRTVQHLNRVMFTATFVLFALSTLHLIAESLRIYRGFINFEGSESYFADLTKMTFKDTVYSLQTSIGDGVLVKIYRCYLVWDNIWMIALLSVLWVAVGVTGLHTVWSFAKVGITNGNSDNPLQLPPAKWALLFCSTTFVTNLLATGLLAFKIWTVNRAVLRVSALHTNSKIYPVILVVMECGALYSLSLIVLIATYAAKSPSPSSIVANMISQIIPITFYLIIIRAALARMTEKEKRSAIDSHMSFANQSTQRSHRMRVRVDLADTELGSFEHRSPRSTQTKLGKQSVDHDTP